jgi:hypothetical protein
VNLIDSTHLAMRSTLTAAATLLLLLAGWLTCCVVKATRDRYEDDYYPRDRYPRDSETGSSIPWALLIGATVLLGGMTLVGLSLAVMWWSGCRRETASRCK